MRYRSYCYRSEAQSVQASKTLNDLKLSSRYWYLNFEMINQDHHVYVTKFDDKFVILSMCVMMYK